MSSHPIFPSTKFVGTLEFSSIIQSITMASSIKEGAVIYLSRKVGDFIGIGAGFGLMSVPSSITHGIAAVTGFDGNSGIRNISFVVLTASIGLVTLTAYTCYQATTSFILKGIVTGIHSVSMMFFSYLANSSTMLGLVNLRSSIKHLVIDPTRFVGRLPAATLNNISEKAETIGSVAFFVSSVAFTILLQNPILANAISYPIAAVVNVTAQRILAEIA